MLEVGIDSLKVTQSAAVAVTLNAHILAVFSKSSPKNPKLSTEQKPSRWGSGTTNPILLGCATFYCQKKKSFFKPLGWVLGTAQDRTRSQRSLCSNLNLDIFVPSGIRKLLMISEQGGE